jgi:hypothetical protein
MSKRNWGLAAVRDTRRDWRDWSAGERLAAKLAGGLALYLLAAFAIAPLIA